MANSKLETALIDLIEAYLELEEEFEGLHGDDEAAFEHAIVEAMETNLEIAIEETGATTEQFATLLGGMSEALEELDPSAFEGEEEEEDEEDYSGADETDIGDEDYEEYDEDDDEEEDEEEEEDY